MRSQNVGWGNLRLADIAYIDEVTHSAFPATEIRSGDVLLNITGASIGRSAVATEALDGGNVNQHVCEIRLRAGRMDPHFVNAFLLSPAGQAQIDMFQAGGNRQGLNFQQVGSIQVPDLPIDQQMAIGAVGVNADNLIATLERLIAKKEAIKQGMMQELLTGCTRLPEFKGEWSSVRIGEVSEFLTGYPFKSRAFAASGIRLIRGSNVKRGVIDWSPEIAMYWPQADQNLRAVALKAGDIVVAMDGALVGRSFARITAVQLPAYLVQRVARLRGNAIDQALLYQWISSRTFAKHVDDVKTQTAIPHISPRDICDFKISIPAEIAEQRAIAGVLEGADQQIALLRSRLAKARAVKTGIMQQLLTGRTRLPVEASI